nr:MAG TPA: hypothetical protein [Caudoviricetes sp.]
MSFRVGSHPLISNKTPASSGPSPTRKPKKLENEWTLAHSKQQKKLE